MEILQAVDAERIRGLRERGEFFWLDLVGPNDSDLHALGGLITIDPLALEDSHEFGQRAKLDDYTDSALLVFYGASTDAHGRPHLVETHLHVSADALVTVSQRPQPALDEARRRVTANPPAHAGGAVYRVLDALADSFLDSLAAFDDAIDALQEALVEHATIAHRRRIFELRRRLAQMHQIVAPQRDLLASSDDLIAAVPRLDHDRAREELRDVHDHLSQAAGLIGSYREQLASLLDLYLTEASNRLNLVMKRLTLIATVFLPLTFVTGFFGMNFGWLVQRITPMWTFLVFGIGLSVASAAAIAVYLRRTDD